ncbi:MAG: hypothetical protein HYT78_15405 [Deltaproteobacteria bacterium]|nr:hypothetical protein [Deltaproteobacteria bacterium]
MDSSTETKQKRAPLFAAIAMGALCSFLVSYSDAGESSGSLQEAEQWEEVAKIRSQAARGHELQAENRREEFLRQGSAVGSTAVGDSLDGAGDEKYLAADDYQKASKHWERAARAYKTAGDSEKAKNALEHARSAWEAAKRNLREGADLHRMGEEQFESANNLDKKIQALKKAARNIERLMEMK